MAAWVDKHSEKRHGEDWSLWTAAQRRQVTLDNFTTETGRSEQRHYEGRSLGIGSNMIVLIWVCLVLHRKDTDRPGTDVESHGARE